MGGIGAGRHPWCVGGQKRVQNSKGVYGRGRDGPPTPLSRRVKGVTAEMDSALTTLREDLVGVARLLSVSDGGRVDRAWVEDARRFVWAQIAALSTLTLSPLPPLPRPKRRTQCVACAALSPRRLAGSLLGEKRCYVHATAEERERGRARSKQEAADVAAFLDAVGWPWPPPPTWKELWRENQRTYTRVEIFDPLMPVVPPWVHKRAHPRSNGDGDGQS